MNPTENTKQLLDAGARLAGAQPRIIEVRGIPCAILEDGQILQVLTDVMTRAEKAQGTPDHKKGTAEFDDLDSFLAHVERNKDPKISTVWADLRRTTVEAIYDYHQGAGKAAGWCRHRARYVMPYSPEWVAWAGKAGDELSQEAFAQHLEDRMEDLTDGHGTSPIKMLEVARDLQVFTKGTFVKKINPESGQFALVCKEEHGEGTTQVPKSFGLALRVFDGGDQYAVEARLRFRVPRGGGGAPVFTYTIHRMAELQRDAFMDIRNTVAEKTQLPLFAGRPEVTQ